mmetsp:Transcript_72872/g.213755  ORF Transcript_72872/g.213755 Transcript_72872/m.213755 type:complete len:258 (+) Transcript_72872:674-1447(+)
MPLILPFSLRSAASALLARASCSSSSSAFVGTALTSAFWSRRSESLRSSFALGTSAELAFLFISSSSSSTWATVGTSLASTLLSTLALSSLSWASTLLEFAFLSTVDSSFFICTFKPVGTSSESAFSCTVVLSSRNWAIVGTSLLFALRSSFAAIASSRLTSAPPERLSSFEARLSTLTADALREMKVMISSSFAIEACSCSSTFFSSLASKSLISSFGEVASARADSAVDNSFNWALIESCSCRHSLTTGATCLSK